MALYLSSTAEADYMSARGMVVLDYQKVADLMGVIQHIISNPNPRTLEGTWVLVSFRYPRDSARCSESLCLCHRSVIP
jgi:hypothetical protein